MDDLAALYDACKPAAFDLNGETVFNDTYCKAKEMDLDAFSTLYDPHSLGILECVSRGMIWEFSPGITEMELQRLNVYGEHVPSHSDSVARFLMFARTGKGDFIKPHKHTPRNENMVGSLVVVLPTRHEGGQFVLRRRRNDSELQEWTFDFAHAFATATEPLVCFVAFFGCVQHEVLPITSGYQVTLTYGLYQKQPHPNASYIPTSFHERLKKALVEIVNDKSTLPEGGYLGCDLAHKYDYSVDEPVNALLDQLQGVDQILVVICEELGLPHSLTLFYRDLCGKNINLIARGKNVFRRAPWGWKGEAEFLMASLPEESTIEDVEGVELVGHPFDRSVIEDESKYEYEDLRFFRPFYRDPVTKMLEIRRSSSVEVEIPWVYDIDSEGTLEHIRAHARMLIALDPVASREELVL